MARVRYIKKIDSILQWFLKILANLGFLVQLQKVFWSGSTAKILHNFPFLLYFFFSLNRIGHCQQTKILHRTVGIGGAGGGGAILAEIKAKPLYFFLPSPSQICRPSYGPAVGSKDFLQFSPLQLL